MKNYTPRLESFMGKAKKKFHPKEIKNTGLAPADFEIIGGKKSPRLVRKDGYHPDDQHREYEYERHDTNNE